MAIQLKRASKALPKIRVDIAKTDLQVECLKEMVFQKKEEILAIENQITILNGKRQGLLYINGLLQDELGKCLLHLGKLRDEDKEDISDWYHAVGI